MEQNPEPFTDEEIRALQVSQTRIEFKKLPSHMVADEWPHFLLWQPIINDNRDKLLKKPVNKRAWQQPGRLRTFTAIHKEYAKRFPSTGKSIENPPMGLGFAYNDRHPFVCIDVDVLTPENESLVKQLASYTEHSPSGKGLHVIVAVTDKIPIEKAFGKAAHRKADNRDLYVSTGYVTLTGQSLNGATVRTMESEKLHDILHPYYGRPAFHEAPEILEPEHIPAPDIKPVPIPDIEPIIVPDIKPVPVPDIPQTPEPQEQTTIPGPAIKKYLDALPVQCLEEDIFQRLQAGKSAVIDTSCTEEARTPWLIIGQAIHNNYSSPMASLIDGYVLWRQWSALGRKFDAQALEDCWRSFKGMDNPITIKALIKLYNAQKPMFPDLTPKGSLMGTFNNFREYLRYYDYKLKYNEIDNRVHLDISKEKMNLWGLTKANGGTLQQKAELILSDLLTIGFPTQAYKPTRVLNFISTLAGENAYNPIRDYFQECNTEWDGKDRIRDLFDTLVLTNRESLADYQVQTIYMFLRKWLIQVVAAACREERKFDEAIKHFNRVLIFVGGQGIGKTKWVQALFPPRIMEYCLGSKELKMSNFRSDYVKTLMEITNTIICNVNEIDRLFTFKTYADFKGFLDTDEDVVVLPYGHEPVHRIRRTIFIGSTNQNRFLTDPTGNRRVELIHVDDLKSEHTIDRDQLWGQVHRFYESGERWWFDPNDPQDELFIQERTRLNSTAMEVISSSFVDYLKEIYDPSQPRRLWHRATFVAIRTQVQQYLAQDRNGGLRDQFRNQKNDLVNWLKQFNLVISETAGKPGAKVYYFMPPIREELAGAGFFEDSDQEITRKTKAEDSRRKYLHRNRERPNKTKSDKKVQAWAKEERKDNV